MSNNDFPIFTIIYNSTYITHEPRDNGCHSISGTMTKSTKFPDSQYIFDFSNMSHEDMSIISNRKSKLHKYTLFGTESFDKFLYDYSEYLIVL